MDPGAGWFPHYAGYAGERGTGAGTGFNRNLPLAPGAGDEEWLAALGLLCGEVATLGVDAVVVSLGLDAAAADPESPRARPEQAGADQAKADQTEVVTRLVPYRIVRLT